MKLTKTEFKGMIKDCIRELLKEGAFTDVIRESIEQDAPSSRPAAKDLVSNVQARSAAAKMAGYDTYSDDADYGHMQINQNIARLVEATSTQMGKGDNQMASAYAAILADTAMNTLPQQMAQDSSRSGYGALAAAGAQGHQEKVAPEELQAIAPSGDVSHWAKLAFGNYNK